MTAFFLLANIPFFQANTPECIKNPLWHLYLGTMLSQTPLASLVLLFAIFSLLSDICPSLSLPFFFKFCFIDFSYDLITVP
jgi:hypothetical protein